MWDKSSQVVMVRLFQTKDLAMAYYDMFKNNKGDLAGINDRGFPLFAISTGNYQKLYLSKDADGYAEFFGRAYLGGK